MCAGVVYINSIISVNDATGPGGDDTTVFSASVGAEESKGPEDDAMEATPPGNDHLTDEELKFMQQQLLEFRARRHNPAVLPVSAEPAICNFERISFPCLE